MWKEVITSWFRHFLGSQNMNLGPPKHKAAKLPAQQQIRFVTFHGNISLTFTAWSQKVQLQQRFQSSVTWLRVAGRVLPDVPQTHHTFILGSCTACPWTWGTTILQNIGNSSPSDSVSHSRSFEFSATALHELQISQVQLQLWSSTDPDNRLNTNHCDNFRYNYSISHTTLNPTTKLLWL